MTGVNVELQRAWRKRRLLRIGSVGLTKMGLSAVIELQIVKKCSDAKIALETVSHALPDLCAAAIFHMSLSQDRWTFVGSDTERAAFIEWMQPEDMLGAGYIARLLRADISAEKRFLILRANKICLSDEFSDFEQPNEDAAIVFDAWGISEGLANRIKKPLFWLKPDPSNTPS